MGNKMYGTVISFLANVDQIQSISPHLPRDGVTIGFLSDILNTNHLICEEMFVQIW
jgi:hypothetical protein